jgi:DNA-binding NarL/FixJ family response regulator
LEKIKIAIAEDHKIVREGYAALLEQEESIDLVFTAEDGQMTLDFLKSKKIDILLLDINMPNLNGTETFDILKKEFPDVKVIMLSMYNDNLFISEFYTKGARAYLDKNCSFQTMLDAIFSVHNQGYYFDEKISKVLLNQIIHAQQINPIFSEDSLTKKEMEVLLLICQEKSNSEIAEILFKSIRTIEGYKARIATKTNSRNSVGMVIYAIKKGLFQMP